MVMGHWYAPEDLTNRERERSTFYIPEDGSYPWQHRGLQEQESTHSLFQDQAMPADIYVRISLRYVLTFQLRMLQEPTETWIVHIQVRIVEIKIAVKYADHPHSL